jgi:hypothetical protein
LLAPLATAAIVAGCNEAASAAPTAPGTRSSAVVAQAASATASAGVPTAGPAAAPPKDGGAAALLARTHEVVGAATTVGIQDEWSLAAYCPVGEVATGGGYTVQGTPQAETTFSVIDSRRIAPGTGGEPRSGWRVTIIGGQAEASVSARVTCIPTQ